MQRKAYQFPHNHQPNPDAEDPTPDGKPVLDNRCRFQKLSRSFAGSFQRQFIG
jgi:hypothetical protein